MEQVSNSVDTTQISVAKKMLALENQVKGGTSWFFWIAGLSILNSIIFFSGGSITFVVGLGATQFIDGFVDGFVSAVVKDVSAGAGTVFRVIGFGLDLLLAGVFAVGGILGRKKSAGQSLLAWSFMALMACLLLLLVIGSLRFFMFLHCLVYGKGKRLLRN